MFYVSRGGREGANKTANILYYVCVKVTTFVGPCMVLLHVHRMKGEKIVANLVPYGPEKPRSGMVRSATTKQVW